MAATITPAPRITGSERNDPAVRLNDYLGAFQFYLGIDDQLVDQIVIVENSDTDLTPFSEIARKLNTRKKIRLIGTSSDYPAERGKGYSEFLMIDSGMSQLSHLGYLEPSSQIWKVTGRLTCVNLSRMISTSPKNYSVYCDLRSVPFIGERFGGNHWMDLRLFSCTLEGYNRYFKGRFGVSHPLEQGFFKILEQGLHTDKSIVPRFLTQPNIQGFGGFDNRDYSAAGYRVKNAVRKVLRQTAPGFWI